MDGTTTRNIRLAAARRAGLRTSTGARSPALRAAAKRMFAPPVPVGVSMPGVTPWTERQLAAIRHAGGGLLVSAAAGSGKTSVLAERCAHAVCDAAEPCDVDELLVVTFTESAATEMRDRIGRAIRARAEASDDPRLHRQAAMLDRASISTLHGFCARLLRQQFHLSGLDPAFRILDADEADLLKREVARDLFADRYGSTDPDGTAFRALVDAYADGDDERLLDRVVAAHESLCSVVDPARWTADADRRLAEAATAPAGRVGAGPGVPARAQAGAGRAAPGVRCRGPVRRRPGRVRRVREAPPRGVPGRPPPAGGVGLARAGRRGRGGRRRRPAEAADGPRHGAEQGRAKDRVDKVNEAIKRGAWRRRLAFTEQQWRDGLGQTWPHAAAFLALVADFGRAYDAGQGRRPRAGLQRPGAADAPGADRRRRPAVGRGPGVPRPVPARDGRRVPGHQRGPGRDPHPAQPRVPGSAGHEQPVLRRRRQAEHLPVPPGRPGPVSRPSPPLRRPRRPRHGDRPPGELPRPGPPAGGGQRRVRAADDLGRGRPGLRRLARPGGRRDVPAGRHLHRGTGRAAPAAARHGRRRRG